VPEGGAVLAVTEDVLDGGPMPVPVLCRGGLIRRGHARVRQDEAVAVDRAGLGELGDRQGALAGVQGAAPPGPRAGGDFADAVQQPPQRGDALSADGDRDVLVVRGTGDLPGEIAGVYALRRGPRPGPAPAGRPARGAADPARSPAGRRCPSPGQRPVRSPSRPTPPHAGGPPAAPDGCTPPRVSCGRKPPRRWHPGRS
jgi:hypothetical protein